MQRQLLVHESGADEAGFPACLEERRLLIPGRRSMLGRKLLNWINVQGLKVEILGEFDDAALMKAFGAAHNAIFVAPTLYAHDFYHDESIVEIGRMDSVMEEYHAIFAERMIQHPAVQRICNRDYSSLFTGTPIAGRRGLAWLRSRQRALPGKMVGIKKPAFAGFFNKVQQAGD